jgi:hypothetical protein
MNKITSHFFLFFLLLLLMGACSKSKFLDAKPSSNLLLPSSLGDFSQLLENFEVMSETGALGTLSSDEYYLDYFYWQALNPKEHNAYIWAPDIYQGQGNIADWNYPYQQVFYANTVLEGLGKLRPDSSNLASFNFIQAWALFVRGFAFFNLAQTFAPICDSSSNPDAAGIPLHLSPDPNRLVKRASLKQTYAQIIADITVAKNLLGPDLPPYNRNHPSKPAALALLARVYLSMRKYDLAGAYADSSLQIYHKLIDYNTGQPFKRMNDETLYQCNTLNSSSILFGIFYQPTISVDSNLYHLYTDSNDLRKILFFRLDGQGNINLVNTYDGNGHCFTGLATDEVLLIRAECNARRGEAVQAMRDLNSLLVNRWRTRTFTPLTAMDGKDALGKILLERRRELLFRGLRFSDLRRLNKEGWQITLVRNLNGQQYSLFPNSPLWVLPIPPDEIALTGEEQNPR